MQTDQQTPQAEQKKTVGIIIPPLEIRKLADTTAGYVAKNGASFETLVMEKEANNPKFSFLKKEDPYRPYYDHKIAEFAKGLIDPQKGQQTDQQQTQEKQELVNQSSTQNQQTSISNQQQSQQQNIDAISNNTSQQQSHIIQQDRKTAKDLQQEIKVPDPDQFTVNQPKGLSPLEVDIIKHTAQFVARNGKKFLTALTEREKQNPQFDFLKPTHDLFTFFMNLVDAYIKCINIKQQDVDKIITCLKDKMYILNSCGQRFEYEQMQKLKQKKKEELDEEERVALQQIDWNDFVVVETIDFFDDESMFNRPTQAQMQQQQESQSIGPLPDSNEVKQGLPTSQPNMTMSTSSSKPSQSVVDQQQNQEVKVKPDYVRQNRSGDGSLTRCQLCGHMIPINELNEHLRIELMDPKYREIKQELQDKGKNITMAHGEEITANLAHLKKKRPDIFGGRSDVYLDEDGGKQPQKILWDGQSATMSRTTANIAMLAQQQKKNYEETIKILSQERTEKTTTSIPIPGFEASIGDAEQVQKNPENKLVDKQLKK